MIALPPLPYRFDALEPVISARTMRLHHDVHARGYVDRLNTWIHDHGLPLETETSDLLALTLARPSRRTARQRTEALSLQILRNNLGQHLNHTSFWNMLAPPATGGAPSPSLADALERIGYPDSFLEAGREVFGSGWVAITLDLSGSLQLRTLHDGDSPLLHDESPILLCDVWEHAYYLDYPADRARYLDQFQEVINWHAVVRRWDAYRR